MPHFLTTSHKTIQCLHQLARIESVTLTKIDKQSTITLLCLILKFLFVALRTFLLLIRHNSLNLWRFCIIGQELTKLQRYNFLYKLILINILEVAADILHKRSNLLVINISLYYLIHHFVKLLLADFLSRRYLCLNKLLTYLFLDITDLELLTAMNDRYRSTLLSCTTCTARAMSIILDIIGQSEVYHMSKVIHIKTSCCHVCCHKQLGKMLAELLHRKVSLGLGEVSM